MKSKRMTLGKKITSLAGLLLLLMIISTIFAITRMMHIGLEMDGIVENDIPLSDVVAQITENQLSQSIMLERGIRHGSDGDASAIMELEESKKEFEEHSQEVTNEIQKGLKIARHGAESAENDEARAKFDNIIEHLNQIEKAHQTFDNNAQEVFSLLHNGQIEEGVTKGDKIEHDAEKISQALESFLVRVQKYTTEAADRANQSEETARRWLIIMAGINITLGIILSLYIIRDITKSISQVVNALNAASGQLNDASGEVSSASQSLAEGASEQAAALEETSSSLEELSAMTKQNAENAGHADGLMKEANQVIDRANSTMNQMTQSMKDISQASEETSKIIKTIDEIAFQTNLLALNAAVEAARAGEAGAGFAVVADEVRNLAMRAAAAAKDTSQLIEGTVQKVNEGSQLVANTNEAFTAVAESSGKVGGLVAEIAGASKEQANGISQINQAVSEMDKVTQQNSATAEESAAASEELNAQSTELLGVVNELAAIVGANNSAPSGGRLRRPQKPQQTVRQRQTQSLPAPPPRRQETKANQAMSPNQIIPMDDDDFEDF